MLKNEARPKKVSAVPGKDVVKLKVAMLGDTSVGKSMLAERYCYDRFSKEYAPTVAVDYKNKIAPFKDFQANVCLLTISVRVVSSYSLGQFVGLLWTH